MPIMLCTKPLMFLSRSKKARVTMNQDGGVELTEINNEPDREYKELEDDGNDNGAINNDNEQQINVNKQASDIL